MKNVRTLNTFNDLTVENRSSNLELYLSIITCMSDYLIKKDTLYFRK